MTHYFTANPEGKRDLHQIEIDFKTSKYRLWTDNGIFSKHGLDIGTKVLLNFLVQDVDFQDYIAKFGDSKVEFLDLGCGSGVISVIMKSNFPKLNITAADINLRAVEVAGMNIALFDKQAQVIASDGLANLPNRKFDLIVTNPPVRIGKKFLYEFLLEAWSALADNGRLYLVIGKKQGADSLQKYLRNLTGNTQVVAHGSGFKVLLIVKDNLL